jgi:hypothetical protein
MNMMRISRPLVLSGLVVLLAACAPPTSPAPPGLNVSTQNFPSTTPSGVQLAPVAPAAPDTGRLSLMQICSSTGTKCTLAFVDSNPTDDVSRLVREYFIRTGSTPAPQISIESTCGKGWVASVMSEQGSVLGGGLLHAQSAVCGYPQAMDAINKALDRCDAQTSGGCRTSTRIKVVWGLWDAGPMRPGITQAGSHANPRYP